MMDYLLIDSSYVGLALTILFGIAIVFCLTACVVLFCAGVRFGLCCLFPRLKPRCEYLEYHLIPEIREKISSVEADIKEMRRLGVSESLKAVAQDRLLNLNEQLKSAIQELRDIEKREFEKTYTGEVPF